jgi:hypothetical protein
MPAIIALALNTAASPIQFDFINLSGIMTPAIWYGLC